MKAQIFPHKLQGTVDKIYSKSYIHRLIICFFLYHIKNRLANKFDEALYENALRNIETFNSLYGCEDTDNTLTSMKLIFDYINKPTDKKTGRYIENTVLSLNCDNSATTLRMLLPILSILNIPSKLYMSQQLIKRIDLEDFNILKSILEQGKLTLSLHVNERCINLLSDDEESFGKTFPQPLGSLTFKNSITSQVLSGVLMSSLLVDEDFFILIKEKLPSFSFIKMTLDMLKNFGINFNDIKSFQNNETISKSFILSFNRNEVKLEETIKNLALKDDFNMIHKIVPLDYSLASLWICANFLANSKDIATYPIRVEGFSLREKSSQDDKLIINILNKLRESYLTQKNISKDQNKDKTHLIYCDSIPDIVPLLCLCAATLDNHKTKFLNIRRIRKKESNRVRVCKNIAHFLGAEFKEDEDSFTIVGSSNHMKIRGLTLESYDDHRVVMLFTLLGTLLENDESYFISKPMSTNKSYRRFWKDLRKLGGKFDIF